MEHETWIDVLNYEGIYKISSLGNLKSINRVKLKSNGVTQRCMGKILPQYDAGGYPAVTLCKNSISSRFGVHRLMVICFIDRDYVKNKKVCNHIDGNKKNNALSNLESVSYSDNIIHAYKNKLNENIAEKHNWAKISNESILQIKEMILNNCTPNEIAFKFGVTAGYVRQIRRGETRKIN